jgi:predicted DNA-binding protein with PD1-like motif
MMPIVRHPGNPVAERLRALPCRVQPLVLQLAAGTALADVAKAAPSAWLRFAGAMDPLRFVIPADAPDASHAAWYSATFAPPGAGMVQAAGLFTGLRDGAPFLHCHGAWDAGTAPRAGHILPFETRMAAQTMFEGWQIDGAQMQAVPDAETNFTLFQPQETALSQDGDRRALLLRIGPNEDIGPALMRVCAGAGLARAQIEGIGSLNGARMADGRRVPPGPTEFLIRSGEVGKAGARLDVVLVDRAGDVTEGVLAATGNPVFVTVEALIVAE